MELTNEFEVAVPVDEAWTVLTDLERIAPCLPGAQLQEVEGDEYRGTVKVKVGPITAQYKGKAHFVEQDAEGRRAVLTASGRDTRGQGDANATITAVLTDQGERTHVSLVTDLALTGKVAQFSRGVLGDVSAKLMDQFLVNLETTVLAAGGPAAGGDDAPDANDASGAAEAPAEVSDASSSDATADETAASDTGATEAAPSVRRIAAPEAEPVDLLGTAGAPMLKRALPLVALSVTLALVVTYLRRRWARRRLAST